MSASFKPRIKIRIPDGLEDVAPEYLESKQREMAVYQVWIDQKNFSEIEKASHKLKGTAAGYGFDELGRLAKDLNLAAKSHDFTRVQALLSEMREHLLAVDLIHGTS